MAKVSVIVPVYNVEKYLDKCLNSLVNQTLNDIEIIIVNDGSLDNSQKIVDSYKKKYQKKIKSYIKENGGLSDARNYGIDIATGDYLAFVDSDDYVAFDMFEKMYEKAISKDFDMVVCDLYYTYPNENKPAYSNIVNDILNKKDIKKIYDCIYPAAWNKLYKRDIIIDNNLRFKKGVWFEDCEFIYRLLPYLNSIGVVKEKLIYYVQREKSISKTYDMRLYNYIDNWNGIIKYYKDNNIYDEYKKELEYSYVRYLYATFVKQCSNYSDKKEYKKAVKKAISERKEHFPHYRRNTLFYKNGLKGIYLVCFNKLIASLYYKLKKR